MTEQQKNIAKIAKKAKAIRKKGEKWQASIKRAAKIVKSKT